MSRLIRKSLNPPPVNYFATWAAAEELERQGKRREAHAIRQQIDPHCEAYAMDPLEILIRSESDTED